MLKAIRENEPRAISLGYQAEHYKLIAFVLSATLSGLAGGTKAIVFQLASLTDVHWTMSGEVVLMTLLGGLGTVFGPVVGAFIVIALENYLAQLGAWVTVVQGAHLRRLRADLPPRGRRRAGPGDQEAALRGVRWARLRTARHRRSKSLRTVRYFASISARLPSHPASNRCRSAVRHGAPPAPSGHRPKASHMAARWMSSAPSISASRSRAISSRAWVGRSQSSSDWA